MENKAKQQSRKAKSLGRHICRAELTFWVVERSLEEKTC
jgi:hypothetical protein